MKLDVVRTQFGEDATNGMLFINGVFECYTLEDEVRDVKVHSETAIPLGEYEVKLRTEGGFHTNIKLDMVQAFIKECYGFKMFLTFNGS